MTTQPDNPKSISNTLAALVDHLIAEVIEQTPTLTDAQRSQLFSKRQQITEHINKSFPSAPQEIISRYYKIATILIVAICCITAVTILLPGIKNLSVIRHLALGYVSAICISWSTFYLLSQRYKRSAKMSNIFAIVSGIGLFALTISWWLSPFTPIEAQPQMGSADLHITATGPVLNGTALLPPDEHLWLLVGSQDKWRPLHRIGVDFATGAWTTAVEPDAFRELGCDARVAIFAVSRKSDQRLQSYVINTSGLRTHTLDSMPEGSKLQHIFNSSIPPNCSSDTTRTQAKPKALQKESTQTNIGAKPLFSPSQGSGDEGGPIAIGVCTHPSGQRALEMQAELNRNVESFKKHPENRDTQLEIAFLQSELGNLDTAEDTLNHVELRNDPNALNYLGLVYLRKCRLPEAIRTFQSAELLRPQGLVAESILANLTHAMWITKRPNKTVEYLENCVRSCRTTDGEAYFRLGDAYLALHDQESARQAFVQVENITVDPDLRARASSKLQIIQSGTRSASSRD